MRGSRDLTIQVGSWNEQGYLRYTSRQTRKETATSRHVTVVGRSVVTDDVQNPVKKLKTRIEKVVVLLQQWYKNEGTAEGKCAKQYFAMQSVPCSFCKK